MKYLLIHHYDMMLYILKNRAIIRRFVIFLVKGVSENYDPSTGPQPYGEINWTYFLCIQRELQKAQDDISTGVLRK